MSNGFLHFVYGEETFLVDGYVAQIRAKYSGYQEDFFKDKVDFSALQMSVASQDLFCPAKLIVIKELSALGETLDAPDVARWAELFRQAALGPNVVVVWMGAKKPDMRKKLCTTLKQLAVTKEFLSFKDWEQDKVLQWLRGKVASMGKQISMDALVAMEQIGGVDLRQLSGILELLVVYLGGRTKIEVADVMAVSGAGNASAFLLTEALRDRKVSSVMMSLSRLLDQGEEPLRLMGLLVATLRLYYQLLVLDEMKLTSQQMGQKLGKSPFFLQKLLGPIKRHYTVQHLRNVFGFFAELDVAIKTGKIKPRIGLEQTVLKFVA